jgi:phenylalanyl-tRNA synthetase beta chain
LLIDQAIRWEQIEKVALKAGGTLLKEVNLFDIYTDEKLAGKKSYAVSFILQDTEKTLTDSEIDRVMNTLVEAFSKQLGAVLRA